MASMEMGMPAGSPVSVATRHSPWDSPAVSNRNIGQEFYGTKIEQSNGFVRMCGRRLTVVKFLLWCILLVVCWPLALVALILYPLIWLLLLPFRLVGIVVTGVLELVWSIVTLPAVVIRKLTFRHP